MNKKDSPVVIEETFKASISEVWDAITCIEKMRQWYFENIPDFQPEVGFETQFIIENEGRIFTHLWKITEVVQKKKITYYWRFEEYPAESYVTFELTEVASLTKLKLSVGVTEDFPNNIPEFKRESCIGGWNYFINERLKTFLDE